MISASFLNRAWVKYTCLFLLGLIYNLALAPVHWTVFLIPSFIGFYLFLIKAKSKREAFLMGLSYGMGQFILMFYWVSFSIFVDFESFWFLLPFSFFGLPFAFSFYYGFMGLAFQALPLHHYAQIFWFIFLYSAVEWLRSHLFTGLPWNLIGYSWSEYIDIYQALSLIGPYGLGLTTLCLFMFPLFFYEYFVRAPIDQAHHLRKAKIICITMLNLISCGLFIGFKVYGHDRLHHQAELIEHEKTPRIRIVQPNIAQKDKFKAHDVIQIFDHLLKLSRYEGIDNIDFVVWPETAVPYFIEEREDILFGVSALLKPNQFLLTGAPRADRSSRKIWNSLDVLDSKGNIIAIYDKFHLVPFGEFIPFKKYIPLQTIASNVDFSFGTGPQTMNILDFPSFSPLICYEAIFSGRVTQKKNRPHWLLNISNDAWFGISWGPYQHFASARARAIEEGLPLVRATNTGFSSLIDAYGNVVFKSVLNQDAVFDFALPKATPPTPFSLFHHKFYFALIFLLLIGVASIDLTLRFLIYKRDSHK